MEKHEKEFDAVRLMREIRELRLARVRARSSFRSATRCRSGSVWSS
jgi:hypothetical protein